MITVVIPVGPNKIYREYLQECIDSIKEQTVTPSEVILVDDMANIDSWHINFDGMSKHPNYCAVKIHKNLWLSGCPHSFNFGIALSSNDLVIMLGSDDKLLPHAVEDALKAWEKYKDPLAYYYYTIVYSHNGEEQSAANNCAMIHKDLWKYCGGFPIQTTVGANDWILLSALLRCEKDVVNFYNIESSTPAYWYRMHDQSITSTINNWPAIEAVKDRLIADWKRPDWGRYE